MSVPAHETGSYPETHTNETHGKPLSDPEETTYKDGMERLKRQLAQVTAERLVLTDIRDGIKTTEGTLEEQKAKNNRLTESVEESTRQALQALQDYILQNPGDLSDVDIITIYCDALGYGAAANNFENMLKEIDQGGKLYAQGARGYAVYSGKQYRGLGIDGQRIVAEFFIDKKDRPRGEVERVDLSMISSRQEVISDYEEANVDSRAVNEGLDSIIEGKYPLDTVSERILGTLTGYRQFKELLSDHDVPDKFVNKLKKAAQAAILRHSAKDVGDIKVVSSDHLKRALGADYAPHVIQVATDCCVVFGLSPDEFMDSLIMDRPIEDWEVVDRQAVISVVASSLYSNIAPLTLNEAVARSLGRGGSFSEHLQSVQN